MLVRALNFDGFVDDPHWVERWRDHVWGAKGVSHFYGPDHPASSCRMVMHHILDRLGVEAMWAPGLTAPRTPTTRLPSVRDRLQRRRRPVAVERCLPGQVEPQHDDKGAIGGRKPICLLVRAR